MTPDQAATLAGLITRAFPGRSVAADIWQMRLEADDFNTARDAIARLIDTSEQPPSVSRYIAVYRSLAAPTGFRYAEPCSICDGTGWESVEVQRPNYPVRTTGVVPCRCSNGRNVEPGHTRAVALNDATLHRGRHKNQGAAA